MRYGISAATLVVRNKQVLLVNHRESGRYDFWVPPGGRLEGDESIFDCARRETLEETGLHVELDHILYIQEFVEPGYHFCKFFILGQTSGGTLTLANKPPGEDFVVDARFLSAARMRHLTVYPDILKNRFWRDLEAEFLPTRYLGQERIDI
jgi:8-oxo-dGTP diphosphatase